MLWWTFQNLVIASVLAALVWLACRSGRVGPVGRHALWLVVLIKLLTPPLVVWPWAVHDPIGLTKPQARAESVHARAHIASPAHRAEVPAASGPVRTSAEANEGLDLGPSEDPQDFTTPEVSAADPSATSAPVDPVSPAPNVAATLPHSRWLEIL